MKDDGQSVFSAEPIIPVPIDFALNLKNNKENTVAETPINSRKIEDLHPTVAAMARKHIELCDAEGIDIIITSTYRNAASQQALFNQGRTPESIKRGEKKVTNAKPGQSWHNYRLAYDVVPIVGGKAVWNNQKLWDRIGVLGKQAGLEWAGDWKRFREMPHFQYTKGLTLADLQSGKTIDTV